MRSIISLLSSGLLKTDLLTVIDASQRDTLLKEMDFSAGDCSDESRQLEIGKLLSAEMIVVGDIAKAGSEYLLSAKMLETETARTVSVADGVYESIDRLIEEIQVIASTLAGQDETEEAVAARPEAAEEEKVKAEPRPVEEPKEAEEPAESEAADTEPVQMRTPLSAKTIVGVRVRY